MMCEMALLEPGVLASRVHTTWLDLRLNVAPGMPSFPHLFRG